MKKLTLLCLVLIGVAFVACDDNVNPKTEFKEEYVLNCILNVDTSYQIATVSKSFDVEGYDPLTNTIDPFISGAKIKVIYKDSVFVFRDTSIQRPAGSRYTTPLNCYYTKKLRPLEYSDLSIEAVLPNGKILNAKTESFFVNIIYFTKTSDIIPPVSANKISFNWYKIVGDKNESTTYFAPELAVEYSKLENGNWVKYSKKIPMYYTENSADKPPIYPEIKTGSSSVSFDTLALGIALREISKDDPNKSNYRIENAIFRLLILDKNLSVYYSTQKTFLDEFSVRLNQPDFTNVNGGLGIFGIYAIKKLNIDIDANYIERFGYRSK